MAGACTSGGRTVKTTVKTTIISNGLSNDQMMPRIEFL
jgi:hypothetical protein